VAGRPSRTQVSQRLLAVARSSTLGTHPVAAALSQALELARSEGERAASWAEKKLGVLEARHDELVATMGQLQEAEAREGGGVLRVVWKKERLALLRTARSMHHGASLVGDFAVGPTNFQAPNPE
jgi:hypothetical protein